MNIIQSKTFNPYFNLATEEYLFKKKIENYFFIFRNRPSVIIGKHQNAYAEVNYAEIIQSNIPVVRRLSGGGTVFHDLGNINFSFIVNREGENLVDFKKHMQPIYELLLEIGINVKIGERNDLFIEGKKISGNAEHIFKNRVLHHGTLLFSADLEQLKKILNTNPDLYRGRAIQSVRSEVGNIANYLENTIHVDRLIQLIIEKIKVKNAGCRIIKLNFENEKEIRSLENTKYRTWEWNFAYSPDFEFTKTIKSNNNFFTCFLKIEKGYFTKIHLTSNFIAEDKLKQLEEALKNTKYEYTLQQRIVNEWRIANKIKTDIFKAFFNN
ncbi:MAG: lipoate--protein ligase [Chlorobi bacterium]|nr:lipoate--protein ligase [Chlorobiota bacterium]